MNDVPKYEGPRMVALLDGTLVFDDSPAWEHLCEARSIAALPQRDREALLFDLDRIRGPELTDQLRKTVNEVIAVAASGIR